MSDAAAAEVRRLLAAGGPDAAATLALRTYGPSLLRYLRSTLRDEDLAGDAFSEFAERFWKGLPGFRWEAALRTWAFGLAHRAALDVAGEAWRRHGQRLVTGEASRLAGELRTATAVRVERQRQALEALRAALSVEDRALLALRVDQELAWDEIAQIVSAQGEPVTAATLTKRFERLKGRLAELARARGLLPE